MDPPAPHASPLGADAALLDAADLVLAAGPGLWGAKRLRHSNAHCVPSSTDAARFAPARVTARCEEYLTAERLQGHILAPRLGHAGIIDDSVDLELLDAAAQRRPDWHFVLAGPVARSGGAVPQRGNIHWLGDQPGIRLPALVAAWDVCLMPYDVGERTRYLCPAHALEYLAAEKPVVSTALPDVSSLFGGVVRVAQDADGFIAACDEALRETPEQRAERLVKSAGCVGRFSWDEAARTVQRLLDDTLARTRRSRQPASPPRLRAATVSAA
jgi:glycosyltransferase involved in cell wall biosynthesis